MLVSFGVLSLLPRTPGRHHPSGLTFQGLTCQFLASVIQNWRFQNVFGCFLFFSFWGVFSFPKPKLQDSQRPWLHFWGFYLLGFGFRKPKTKKITPGLLELLRFLLVIFRFRKPKTLQVKPGLLELLRVQLVIFLFKKPKTQKVCRGSPARRRFVLRNFLN
jgi:hypothetical protein